MKKATRRLLVILLFAAGLSYFAFTLIFFDPLEGSYMDGFEAGVPVALEYAVPVNVDFFFHKRGLEEDMDTEQFPVPRAWEDVELARNWRQFENSPLYQDLAGELALEAKVEQVREVTEQVPILHPLTDAFGRDVAVFGRVAGRGFEKAEVCALFLGSGKAKLAYEVAGSGLLRSLFGMPFEVTEDDVGVRCITLADGQSLYVHRQKDLFVVGSGPNLVKESLHLLDLGREQSLGYTRRYHGTVAQDVAEFAGLSVKPAADTGAEAPQENRVQLHANLQALFSLVDFDDAFLEHRGEVSRWLLARLFSPRYFRDCTLDIGFGESLDVRGTIVFDKAQAEATESGFYDRRTFGLRDAMDRAAALLPEDTYFVMAARLDLRQFLPKLVTGLSEVDPPARQIMDELIAQLRKARPDFKAGNALEAARAAASFLGEDVVVALKRDTYFGPPEDAMPLIAIFLEVTDKGPEFETLESNPTDPLRATGYNGFVFPMMAVNSKLKQEGRGVAKWFKVWHEVRGTPDERFVQDVMMTLTDIENVAFGIIDPRSKTKGPWTLVVTLSPRVVEREVYEEDKAVMREFGSAHELITDCIKLSRFGPDDAAAIDNDVSGKERASRAIRPLIKSPKYQQGRDFLEKRFASVALYVDAAGLKTALEDAAANDVPAVDWVAKNKEFSEQLYAGDFRAWKGKNLPPDVQEKFNAQLKDLQDSFDRDRKIVAGSQTERAKQQASLAWLDLFKEAFLAARIDENSENIEIGATIRTNLED